MNLSSMTTAQACIKPVSLLFLLIVLYGRLNMPRLSGASGSGKVVFPL
jgi:hypothetical protein